MANIASLGRVVGNNVQALRLRRGWSQEAAAIELRTKGLAWTRSQLADLEIGRRQDLTVSELLLLAETFGVRLDELFAGEGSARLSPTVLVPLTAVRQRLTGGEPGTLELRTIPGLNPQIHGQGPYLVVNQGRKGSRIYSTATVNAAKQLGTEPERVHELSRTLWGTVFDQERDRRLGERGRDTAPPTSLTGYRSHITRELIEDLRHHLNQETGKP